MAWVVDDCLLIDIADADSNFGIASAQFPDAKRDAGLLVCPAAFIELAPVFGGNFQAQQEFLFNLEVGCVEPWMTANTQQAHAAWRNYVIARRFRHIPKRPLVDVLFGAFAQRFVGLLTRNPADFRLAFPLSPSNPRDANANPKKESRELIADSP